LVAWGVAGVAAAEGGVMVCSFEEGAGGCAGFGLGFCCPPATIDRDRQSARRARRIL